jgi:hypothetical protein
VKPRKPTTLIIDDRDPLPAVLDFAANHANRLGPGLHHVVIVHDVGCTYLRGGPCTCKKGPEIQVPASN